jgi:hypothetical protein
VKGELVQNFAQAATGQKTREIAAEKAGFGNAETYRQAKTVVQNASPELVEAMDNGARDIVQNFAQFESGTSQQLRRSYFVLVLAFFFASAARRSTSA